MDVRFCARQEPLPRGIDCTLRVLQSPFWALSRAPQKDPCFLLTKTYMDVGKPDVAQRPNILDLGIPAPQTSGKSNSLICH